MYSVKKRIANLSRFLANFQDSFSSTGLNGTYSESDPDSSSDVVSDSDDDDDDDDNSPSELESSEEELETGEILRF